MRGAVNQLQDTHQDSTISKDKGATPLGIQFRQGLFSIWNRDLTALGQWFLVLYKKVSSFSHSGNSTVRLSRKIFSEGSYLPTHELIRLGHRCHICIQATMYHSPFGPDVWKEPSTIHFIRNRHERPVSTYVTDSNRRIWFWYFLLPFHFNGSRTDLEENRDISHNPSSFSPSKDWCKGPIY